MDKITVCHITSAHERYDTRIFHKECKTLVANNYDVSLIVNDLYQEEIIDSINILSTGFKPKNRFQRMIKSQKLIKKRAIEVDADIYHLHDPELLRLASFLKSKNKKVIFDSHEDYVLTIEVKKWIPKPLRTMISKLYQNYENRVISKIDGALVCYHWTEDRYTKINTNTKLLFNFPKLSDYRPVDINYGSHNIVYAGGITDQWNHDYVIRSLGYTKNRLKYILVGNIEMEYLDYLNTLDGFDKVIFKGKLPYEEVLNDIYPQASIGVALLDYIPQCKYTVGNLSNTKLFEFMLMKLPVVCTDFDLWKEIINNEKCGICVNPKNPKEIADAFDYIAENPAMAKSMGENGFNAVKNKYNWEKDSENLLEVYKRIEEKL